MYSRKAVSEPLLIIVVNSNIADEDPLKKKMGDLLNKPQM